jgi:ABC-type uncharacterized transport system permease subunit
LLFGPIFYALVGWLAATVMTAGFASNVAIGFLILGIFLGAMIGLFVSAISALIANTAERKGRSYVTFFMLSLLFSPIVMGIISATMSTDVKLSQAVPKSADVQTGSKSTSSKLKELQELRDSGLITQKEFDTKKKSLLENM